MPLLAPGGLLLAFKGKELATDLAQVSTRKGGEVLLVAGRNIHTEFQMKFVSFKLPFLNLSRTLVMLTR